MLRGFSAKRLVSSVATRIRGDEDLAPQGTKKTREAFVSELTRLSCLFVRFPNDLISSYRSSADSVGLPGFEPRMTGPESVVLPLHHSPIVVCECKSRTYFFICKENYEKFVYLLKDFVIFT